MKKQIAKKLSLFVLAFLVIFLYINGVYQYHNVVATETEGALYTIDQIEDILITNEASLETLTNSLKDEYIIKAQMTAFIWENTDISTTEEYQELVELLNIDEIHIFNESGEIYEGSEAQYFGYSFDSGEQMSFFLPMLEDKSLTLCQDITPNTAEEKPMMYVATWSSDGSTIVQIGLEPERILEEQSENELSYIFSNMPTDDEATLFAIDANTGIVVGCSRAKFLYDSSVDIGLDTSAMNLNGESFFTQINGVNYLCVFQTIDSTYIGVAIEESYIYEEVVSDVMVLNTFFTLASIFLYISILWIIHITILKNFDLLTNKVNKISGGDLDTKVDINSSPEFSNLSNQLNIMVTSLLHTTDKMSSILEHTDTKMAVYEYKKDMKRVFATHKLSELLSIPPGELAPLLEDKELFEIRIQEIKKNTTADENVYTLNNNTFLNIETLTSSDGEYGLIVDVSEATKEKYHLKYERDYDVLTDLYNRRAFLREIEYLFQHPEIRKESVILALDMDNLKVINDTHGHDSGDDAIKCCADVLRTIPTSNKVLCRLGGDEFIAIIYGEDTRSKLTEYVTQLEQNYIHASICTVSANLPIKMSAGYLYSNDFKQNYDVLAKYADEALYIAKRNGKSCFVQYI